ncbi:MAG: ArsB/NhaD family transporter [Candidatus Jordarchaeales archaeon]
MSAEERDTVQEALQSYIIEVLRNWIYTPPALVNGVFLAILVVTLILLIVEKINKTLTAMCGAVATIIAGRYFEVAYGWVPVVDAFLAYLQGSAPRLKPLLFTSEQVLTEMVDWQSIVIVISLLIVSSIVSRSGLFEYIGVKLVKMGGGDFRRIFIYFCVLTFALTAMMGAVPAFVIIVSLTLTLTRSLGIDPKPYILGELFVGIHAGIATLTSNVGNIVVASHYNMNSSYFLDYGGFLLIGAPFAATCSAISILIIQRSFKEVMTPAESDEFSSLRERVLSLDESSLIENRAIFRRTILLLALMIVGFIIANPIGIPLYVVALSAAIAFLILGGIEPRKAILEVDWELMLFLLGIFIVIGGVCSTGVLNTAGEIIGSLALGNMPAMILMTIITSTVFSGVLEDVPVAVVLLYVIPVASLSALVSEKAAVWALIYGMNIGSILTPVGETRIILALSVLSKDGSPVSGTEFMKLSIPILVLSILIGVAFIYGLALILGWNTITPEQIITLLTSPTTAL